MMKSSPQLAREFELDKSELKLSRVHARTLTSHNRTQDENLYLLSTPLYRLFNGVGKPTQLLPRVIVR